MQAKGEVININMWRTPRLNWISALVAVAKKQLDNHHAEAGISEQSIHDGQMEAGQLTGLVAATKQFQPQFTPRVETKEEDRGTTWRLSF